MKTQDNAANGRNANKGTTGTNKQYAQVHGNRGKQMAGKQSGKGAGKGSGKGGRK